MQSSIILISGLSLSVLTVLWSFVGWRWMLTRIGWAEDYKRKHKKDVPKYMAVLIIVVAGPAVWGATLFVLVEDFFKRWR